MLTYDIQKNLSSYGLVCAIDGGLDNLPVGQATLIMLQEILREDTAITATALRMFEFKCAVARGLYRRTPDNKDQNSVDNYIAMCFADAFIARDIHWRCVYRLGVFANDKFEPRSIFARFFGFRPFAKFMAGKTLNRFDRWLIKVSIRLTLNDDPTDTSNKCLQVLINHRLKNHYDDIDAEIAAWVAAMEKQYPTGLKCLYSYYWKPGHALFEAAPMDWDFLK